MKRLRNLQVLNKVHPWQNEPVIKKVFNNSETNDIEVSLVIPFFNQKQTLKECLKNAINNASCNFEIILINDGSDDNSFEIALNTVLDYKSKTNFKSATIITNEFPIYETACDNQGFMMAKGKYIIEIQSDIYIYEYGYDKIMIKFKESLNLSTVSAHSIHSFAHLLGKKFLFKNPFQFFKYRFNNNIYDHKCSIFEKNTNKDNNKIHYITGETCARGPWLLFKEDLEKYGYLDQKNFFLGNDDHDYNYRIYKKTGRICGFVDLDCFSDLNKGASRKKRSGTNEKIFNYLKATRLSRFRNIDLIKHFSTYRLYAKLSFIDINNT